MDKELELIAQSLGRIADAMEKRVALEYPAKREVRDADVTRLPSDDELLREGQGQTEESLIDWIGSVIDDGAGPRERAYVDAGAAGISPEDQAGDEIGRDRGEPGQEED